MNNNCQARLIRVVTVAGIAMILLLALSPVSYASKRVVRLPGIRQIVFTEATATQGEEGPGKTVRIPLKRTGRLFLVEANIDGLTGNFVFDTGADKLVLNSTYFRKNLREPGALGGGLTGASHVIYRTRVDRIEASGLVLTQMEADVTQLGAIEDRRGQQILGLLGIGFFKGCELIIDLHNNQLEICPLDRRGRPAGEASGDTIPDYAAKLNIRNKILFLRGEVGGKNLDFCLDTAAETNVISNTASQKILETISITGRSELTGAGGGDREVLYGIMNDFSLGELKFRPMRTIIANLASLSQAYDFPVGGILGFDFFDQGVICINLVTDEIRIRLNERGEE